MKRSGDRKFRFAGRSPLTVVEMIIAISTIIGGLYVLSPFLDVSTIHNGPGTLVATIGSQVGIIIFGSIFLVSGLLMIYGIIKRKYRFRTVGLFINIMARTYAILGGFLINGLLPLTWMSNAVLTLVCVVCYLVVRGMIVRQEADK